MPSKVTSEPAHKCTCSSTTVTRYQESASGLPLDRIGPHIEVPQVEYEKKPDDHLGELSTAIQEGGGGAETSARVL